MKHLPVLGFLLVILSACGAPQPQAAGTGAEPGAAGGAGETVAGGETAVGATGAGTDSWTRATTEAPPVAVLAEALRDGVLRDTLWGQGLLQGVQEVVVRAQTQGTIASVDFTLGSRLEAGAPLVTVDRGLARLAYDQLVRQLETARADLKGTEDLFALGSASQTQLNRQRDLVNGLTLQVEQARDTLGRTVVAAPFTGQVAEKAEGLVTGGNLSLGQVVARLVDLSRLRVSIPLGESQVLLAAPGQSASLRIDTVLGTFTAEGRVLSVAAGADGRTGSWTVLTEFPNPAPEVLKAGLSAQVTIQTDRGPRALIAPTGAVVEDRGRARVYIADADSRARAVDVLVLDRYGARTAIRPLELGLLGPGTLVLTSGLTQARGGARVALNTTVGAP